MYVALKALRRAGPCAQLFLDRVAWLAGQRVYYLLSVSTEYGVRRTENGVVSVVRPSPIPAAQARAAPLHTSTCLHTRYVH